KQELERLYSNASCWHRNTADIPHTACRSTVAVGIVRKWRNGITVKGAFYTPMRAMPCIEIFLLIAASFFRYGHYVIESFGTRRRFGTHVIGPQVIAHGAYATASGSAGSSRIRPSWGRRRRRLIPVRIHITAIRAGIRDGIAVAIAVTPVTVGL